MHIDFNGNLKWKSDWRWYGSNDQYSVFTRASIGHFFSGIMITSLIYILIQYNRKLSRKYVSFSTLVISNIIHITEDFLENIKINGTTYSLEGLISKIAQCQNSKYMDLADHDCLQNYIGDVLSYGVGSIIAIFTISILLRRISHTRLLVTLCLVIIVYYALHGVVCRMAREVPTRGSDPARRVA